VLTFAVACARSAGWAQDRPAAAPRPAGSAAAGDQSRADPAVGVAGLAAGAEGGQERGPGRAGPSSGAGSG
jgi:hypothetical protein